MENDESPTKIPPLNQSNSAGRNVLKELNNLDGATKSPKQLSSKDDPESPTETSNLLKNLPDIITNVQLDVDTDDDIINETIYEQVVSDKNRLMTATPDDQQSEDELFFDCNSTHNVSTNLDKTIQFLEVLCNSDIVQNQTFNSNETGTSGENLNDAFINVTDTPVANLEPENNKSFTLNIDNQSQDPSAVQNQPEDIPQLTVSNASKDSTLSVSFIGGIEIATPNINSQSAEREYKSFAAVEDTKVESNKLNKTSLVATGVIDQDFKVESNKLDETVVVANAAVVENSKVETDKLNETIDVATAARVEGSKVESNQLNKTGIIAPTAAVVEKFKVESNQLNETAVLATGSIDGDSKVETNKSNETIVVATGAVVENSKVESNNLNETVVVATAAVVEDSKFESNNLNEIVVVASIADHQQETDSKPISCQITEVESEDQTFISCKASLLAGTSIEKALTTINEVQGDVSTTTHLNSTVNAEASQNLSNAGTEIRNLNETKRLEECIEDGACHQEKTFMAINIPSNSTIVLDSTNIGLETEIVAYNVNDSENAEFPTLKQIEKIREFQTNQTISVDSLEAPSETRACSVDSIEIEQHQQPTSTETILINVNANGMMEDSPVVSETLVNLNHSIANANKPALTDHKQTFVGHLLPQDTLIPTNSVDSEVPVVSENVKNPEPSHFYFKTPMLPNVKMNNDQFAGVNSSDFMVLNSNDFDFLISRGGSCVDPEEDRRNSILLRFDPLSKTRPSVTPFTPAVQIIEESVQGEQSLVDIKSIVEEIHSNTSGENSADEQKLATAKPPSTNEAAMSVGLVHNSNSMDNEAKAYVNNIKADRTEEKHIQIDSVPLSDKKIKFDYTDGNIKKKMDEYEATQEILLKRITEKDKTVSKNCSIIEAYEKALAELVVEKEKLTESYEINNEKLRQERDIHHQHLMSLENTFSDLHMKYERSKEFTAQLQDRLDFLTEEKAKIDELLKQQEVRYEKMKEHALHQLETANATLEEQDRNNSREVSRLKAQLKMEEISKVTFQEQLFQKKKENDELVKICDELIGGQKS